MELEPRTRKAADPEGLVGWCSFGSGRCLCVLYRSGRGRPRRIGVRSASRMEAIAEVDEPLMSPTNRRKLLSVAVLLTVNLLNYVD
ncbi:unnamed protein product, partial [Toxocara canis]|uniref:Uncharacterized protein n=1 Tax=Toxocara canis TaxID=6265 RepID=A0A183UUN5_TOXCA